MFLCVFFSNSILGCGWALVFRSSLFLTGILAGASPSTFVEGFRRKQDRVWRQLWGAGCVGRGQGPPRGDLHSRSLTASIPSHPVPSSPNLPCAHTGTGTSMITSPHRHCLHTLIIVFSSLLTIQNVPPNNLFYRLRAPSQQHAILPDCFTKWVWKDVRSRLQ